MPGMLHTDGVNAACLSGVATWSWLHTLMCYMGIWHRLAAGLGPAVHVQHMCRTLVSITCAGDALVSYVQDTR